MPSAQVSFYTYERVSDEPFLHSVFRSVALVLKEIRFSLCELGCGVFLEIDGSCSIYVA
jgi:hypothetical protein